jgi:L-cysteine:1D-myo-inositol 2-amino-2-deoxy-alpha-D-glucopyranoside ligase
VPSDTTGPARLYVCGITPYDATHLGHAATYLAFDLLQRQWLDRGIEVDYVQNVTDIDDPLLERAAATGVEWSELAAGQAERFRADMAALRIVPPREWCGVTESMTDSVELIAMLADAAYLVEDDLYFDVDGRLGTQLDERTMVSLFAERGGDPDRPGKRHPLDCLLWRAARPGEPSWDSPWGPGRPGWHIECAAIAHARLGPAIDVIGGGSDLAFPHHAMSAAETAAATGQPAARTYLHTGMVAYGGAKMAKSDGNLVLYRNDAVPLWHTETYGTSPGRAIMQLDGNLVVYDGSGTPIWASGTVGFDGAWLVMQADGNLVIYSSSGAPVWASGTSGS